MEQKVDQIKKLTEYLLTKFGSSKILITDYWDADNTAIGITDKSKQYTVYISSYMNNQNRFFVSLENPSSSTDFPYEQGEEYNNLTVEEVENILMKHLRII